MAKIILDDSMIKWTEFDITQVRDTSIVAVGALKNKFFNSGAAKLSISAELTATTEDEKGYLEGFILPIFINNDTIEFTPPSNLVYFRGTATEGLMTDGNTTAGSNAIDIQDTSSGTFGGTLPQGTKITFTDHEGVYTISSYDATNQQIVISPNLRADVADEDVITYDGIKFHMQVLEQNIELTYDKANTAYTTLELEMEEVI